MLKEFGSDVMSKASVGVVAVVAMMGALVVFETQRKARDVDARPAEPVQVFTEEVATTRSGSSARRGMRGVDDADVALPHPLRIAPVIVPPLDPAIRVAPLAPILASSAAQSS